MSGAPERSQAFSMSAEPVSLDRWPPQCSAPERANPGLDFLNEIIGSLPTSVTVQDEQGNFLFVNDAAAAQFNVSAAELLSIPEDRNLPSTELNDRRDFAVAALQSGSPRISEEVIRSSYGTRTFLTAHRMTQIGSRKLLLSSSVDFTEHKAIQEDRSFPLCLLR